MVEPGGVPPRPRPDGIFRVVFLPLLRQPWHGGRPLTDRPRGRAAARGAGVPATRV